MIAQSTTLTPTLARWLSHAHDGAPDRGQPLRVRQLGAHLEVLQADGAELSESERIEVTSLLAAHAAGGSR
mgnify:CR=1 FL=1